MITYNLLANVFNQLLTNPRSSPQEKSDQFDLKQEFEKQYGAKNYFLIPSSGSSKSNLESVKLIALHHDAVMNSAKRIVNHFNLDSSMAWGCVLPLFHVAGLGIHARGFVARAKVHQKDWTTDGFTHWLSSNDIQLLSLVPTQIFDLVQKNMIAPKGLRHVFVGGAKLDSNLKEQILKLNWPIVETYGMTETSSMIAIGDTKNMRLLPDIEVVVTDKRLKIKCNSLMTCSLQKIDGKVHFKTPENGWYHTEDFAEVSMQGQNVVLKLLGRQADFIKINAEGVSLIHLRELLEENNKLALVALVNQRSGFDIVLVHENVEHIKGVVAEFNKQVKPFEMIRKVFCVDEIPKTDLNKIMYKKLEETIKEMPFEKV